MDESAVVKEIKQCLLDKEYKQDIRNFLKSQTGDDMIKFFEENLDFYLEVFVQTDLKESLYDAKCIEGKTHSS
jgi:hypothetical protein